MKKIAGTGLVLHLILALLLAFTLTSTSFAIKVLPPPSNHEEYLPPQWDPRDSLLNIETYPAIISRNLTVVPIRVRYTGKLPSALALEEAINMGALSIIETGSVNELYVENRSNNWVFLMGGEILKGGKQNRILKHDLLLSPWSGRVNVGAFCVEQGRWSSETPGTNFKAEKNLSGLSVRQMARESKDQSSVWDAVSETNKKVQANAPTGAMNEAYKALKVTKNKEEYVKDLYYGVKKANLATGFVAFVNGKILASDLFGSQQLFEKYKDKLFESYALEAIAREGEDELRLTFPETKAKRFIEDAASANLIQAPRIGSGYLYELQDSRHTGSLLVSGKGLVHAEIFPKTTYRTYYEGPGIDRQYPR